ncbi:MAG TPA: DUF924 family protein [Bacteriovoracaceae bacterium]|nr:DUF924 family protein [Bacteriovoracaceae bacterium]
MSVTKSTSETSPIEIGPAEILKFWFDDLTPADWFKKDAGLDRRMRERFSGAFTRAFNAELDSWRVSVEGRLAEILLLDQFPRNIHRDTPLAFAGDRMALVLAQEMVRQGLDKLLEIRRRAFVYLPYMHSESKAIHQDGLCLFSLPGLENNLKFEILHKEIIDRFERYPSRNKALARHSTQEEVEFLKTHRGF